MARTPSTMLPLGTEAPPFTLMNVDGSLVSLSDFDGAPAFLAIFMCNHCPFVKHLADALAQFGAEYMAKGVAIVGISSNDVSNHPADSQDQLVNEPADRGYRFPSLFAESQEVPKKYRAACTPDSSLSDAI